MARRLRLFGRLSSPWHKQQSGFVIGQGGRHDLLYSFDGCNRSRAIHVTLAASRIERICRAGAKLPHPLRARRIICQNEFH